MRCVIHEKVSGLDGLTLADRPIPVPGPGEVLIEIRAAALNHRDIWTCLGRDLEKPAAILGSDGAGVIVGRGPGVEDIDEGAEVVVNPTLDWPDERKSPPRGGYDELLIGYPTDGTLAEYAVVPRANVEPKPAHLSWEQAAAAPLVGITIYRALFTEGELQSGQTVVIPGIGAGTSIMALQLAKAAGARVVVTSRSPEKGERAKTLGADLALTSDAEWASVVRDFTDGTGADLVIESVGAPTWKQSVACLRRGGRLVVFGATAGDIVEVDLAYVFLNWISIQGTTMGNTAECRAMLAMVNQHEIEPVIDRVFPLSEGVDAIRYLDAGTHFGKIVICPER
jgi:zinc-binding alcohol dehydrogenase/oxidoreductase